MSDVITNYFLNAQLSQAAYADLTGGLSIDALTFIGMSETQAEDFISTYEIIDHLPNTDDEGFSATIFRNKETGKITFAIRGTDQIGADLFGADFGDIGGDGIAIAQALDMYNYYLRLTARQDDSVLQFSYDQNQEQLIINSFAAQEDGMLVDQNFTVAGHSLGGHLAMILGRLTPNSVDTVHTYVAPGFDPAETNPDPGSEWLFNELRDAEIAINNQSEILGFFDTNKMNHIAVTGDFVHAIGNVPGEQPIIFSELENEGIIDAHSKNQISDSLAVYDLLGAIDNNLISKLPEILEIFRAISNDKAGTLESLVNVISPLFPDAGAVKVADGDRDALYSETEKLKQEIELFPSMQITSLADLNAEDIKGLASVEGAIAYRYALMELNSFAITGNDTIYNDHNLNGELDLYNLATGLGMTDEYLTDRAAFLYAKIIMFKEDRVIKNIGPENITYRDINSGIVLHDIGLGGAGQLSGRLFTFGGDGADPISGNDKKDRLYGGDGNDFIEGKSADDYLEGNQGQDGLVGGTGEDTLIGGQGNDVLWGGNNDGTDDNAKDILKGGAGNDTYFVGDGDIIEDSDRQGSIIFNGIAISGTYTQLTDNSYKNETTGVTIAVSGTRAIVQHIDGETATSFRIENFQDPVAGFNPGDFGITLGGSAPLPEPSTLIEGTGNAEIIASGGNIEVGLRTSDAAELINAFGGDDTINSVGGDDVIFAGQGDDLVNGGTGNDQIFGEAGLDRLTGGEGADLIDGGLGRDILRGSNGDDVLIGGDGVDTDLLSGGLGADTLNGGAGDDFLFGDWTAHTQGANWRNWTLTLVPDELPNLSPELFITIPSGVSLNNGDILYGGAGNDYLHGYTGDDTLFGGADNDILDGGDGNDELYGGMGEDILRSRIGDDILFGDAGMDELYGAEGDDELYGGTEDDILDGGTGSDLLDGGSGNDTYHFGSGNKQIRDSAGSDTLIFNGVDVTALDMDIQGDTLQIVIGTDTLTIENWTSSPIEFFQLPDSSGGSVTLDVANIETMANQPPIVAELLTDQVTDEEASFSFTVPATAFTDADAGDTLSFTGAQADGSTLPAWLFFDEASRTFSGIPDDADVGVVDLRVTATDDMSVSASSTFSLTVNNINDAPIAIADIASVESGTATSGTVTPSNEFAVASHINGHQYQNDIVGLVGGGFVVVWASNDSATGDPFDIDPLFSYGVSGQRFDNEGNKVGNEFLVNNKTQYVQDQPSVSALADGGFVAVWSSWDSTTGDDFIGVAGRVFGADGVAVGGEFMVNTTLTGDQHFPSVTTLNDGSFVVLWQTPGLSGQRFSATGEKLGNEFLVGNSSIGSPRIVGLASGDFVAVWREYTDAGNTTITAKGQRFSANGVPVGNEVPVNPFFSQMSVAALNDGGYVVVSINNDPAHVNFGEVVAQRFNAVDEKVGGEIIVNLNPQGILNSLDVTAQADGGFVVTGLAGAQIAGQRFDAQGQHVGGEFQVNAAGGSLNTPVVAGLENGGFATVWGINAQVLPGYSLSDPNAPTNADTIGIQGRVFLVPPPDSQQIVVDVLANDTDADLDDGPTNFTLDSASVQGDKGQVSIFNNQLLFDTQTDFNDLVSGHAELIVVDYTLSDDEGSSASSTASIVVHNGPVVIGSEGNDTITVTENNVPIFTFGGNDVITLDNVDGVTVNAGSGDDTLRFLPLDAGNTSTVTARGGAGDDRYEIDGSSYTITIDDSESGPNGNTLVFGPDIQANSLILSIGSLKIDLGENRGKIHLENFDPNDVLGGPRTIDTFEFADGSSLSFEELVARGFDINGTATNDSLTGTNLTDRMAGLAGDDMLNGGAGDDTLDGGVGNDNLSGGSGNDTYVYPPGDGQDIINDASGADQIRFGAGITVNSITVEQVNNDLVLSLNANDQVTVAGWFSGVEQHIEQFVFTDENLSFTDSQIEALIGGGTTNQPPEIGTGLNDIISNEDAPFSFTVPVDTFIDPDAGDNLTLTATLADGNALPSWLSFDAVTQTFSGTPANDDVDVIDVKVTATDTGGLSVNDIFSVTINNVNDAPVLANAITDQSTDEDAPFSFTVPAGTFVDDDSIHGDTLNYSASLADDSALPSWLSFDESTQAFSGTPDNNDVDVIDVKVTAADTSGIAASDDFTLTVNNVNDAPVVANAITDQNTDEDAPFSFTVPVNTFTDDDAIHGDNLSYGATLSDDSALPAWLSFDAVTQTFSGTPPAGTIGEQIDVQITATDLNGLSTSDTFSLTITEGQRFNIINGGDKRNHLDGTEGSDLINGFDDDDDLHGKGGDDIIYGGEGKDKLKGGDGDDQLFGGAGDDKLEDKHGNNLLDGGEGDDKLKGGDGDDQLFGGAGKDKLEDKHGNNLLDGGEGDDKLKGGDGDDQLFGGAGKDKLDGKKGDDQLSGGEGDDKLKGGDGDDQLFGGAGKDKLEGGRGDDTYLFNRGDDRDEIKEDGGHDLLRFGEDIAANDLWFWQDKKDLKVGINGTDDNIKMDNWYKKDNNRVEVFELSDGLILLESQAQQLVDAMAVFNVPKHGGLEIPQETQEEVAPVIAAVWSTT